MLIDNNILKQIDDIVERSYISFIYNVSGEEFLTDEQKVQLAGLGLILGRRPLIEILYWLVRQTSSPLYQKDKTLNRILEEIASTGILPNTTPQARYTAEHAKAVVKQAIDQSKEALKTKIKSEILKANIEAKEEQSSELDFNVANVTTKREKNSNKLIKAVTGAALLAGVASIFRKEFTAAMTNLVNSATVDQIVGEAVQEGIRPKEVLVYKEVVNDSRLSPECRRLHLNPDGSPRIYTLKELQSNGSNVGKPKSQWRAVIGGTHPNCRCTLRYVKD